MYLICSQLCDEIDEHEKNSPDMIEEDKKKIPAYKKTSLLKPIGVFVQFLKGLEGENDNRRKSFRDAEGEMTKTMNLLSSFFFSYFFFFCIYQEH